MQILQFEHIWYDHIFAVWSHFPLHVHLPNLSKLLCCVIAEIKSHSNIYLENCVLCVPTVHSSIVSVPQLPCGYILRFSQQIMALLSTITHILKYLIQVLMHSQDVPDVITQRQIYLIRCLSLILHSVCYSMLTSVLFRWNMIH
jgi:hypothetical protein